MFRKGHIMPTSSPKVSLKQSAYEYIKEQILSCRYAPSTFLNEQLLCAETGVSRTPIRDALSRLEQEGLVTIMPKKGIMVSGIRLSDINHIYEVRQLLEPYALRQYHSRIDMDTFRKVVGQIESYHTDPNANQHRDVFYYLDDQFHNLIVQALPNPYLQDTYNTVSNLNRRLRVLSGDTVACRMDQTYEEHSRVINAFLEENWDLAADELSAHLDHARSAAFQLIINSENLLA